MIVKIVTGKVEYVHECESYEKTQHEDNDNFIEFDLHPGSKFLVDKRCSEVFVMSREGSTIDTYRWK